MNYPPCLIVFPKQTLVWEVSSTESLTPDDFLLLKYLTPKPTYVIVGVTNPDAFPSALRQELSSRFENFDVLEMVLPRPLSSKRLRNSTSLPTTTSTAWPS